MKGIKIKVKRLHSDAKLPSYAHPGDAGLDLFSVEELTINSGERALVPTGLSIEIPEGYVSLIWDKSGIGNKGVTTFGGVIEHSYRGEYKVILYNSSKEDFRIEKGQKIAQILIQPIMTAEVEEVSELSDTSRGEGGFGSTGK